MYAIIREPEFETQISGLSEIINDIAKFESGIDWALGRGPIDGTHFLGNYYVWTTLRLESLPSFNIIYLVEEENRKIYLIQILENN